MIRGLRSWPIEMNGRFPLLIVMVSLRWARQLTPFSVFVHVRATSASPSPFSALKR